MTLLPIMVMPISDPGGMTLPHLKTYTPLLQSVFERAIVSLTANTRRAQPGYAAWLETESFYQIVPAGKDSPAGVHFRELYTFASLACPPDQILHLCYPDRVTFALGTGHHAQFLADVKQVGLLEIPLIFHRSPAAWTTHPRNYQDLEGMVTRAGELLFGKTVDYAWCHLVLTAGRLGEILPHTRREDISMVAEMALALLEDVKTQEVDWLAWEDPFVLGVDAQALKEDRQGSQQEHLKRLAYIIPMLEILYDAAALKNEG